MAIIKKNTSNKYWWRCGEKRTLYTAGGNVNWCRHHGKQYGSFPKTTKKRTTIWPSNSTPGHIFEKKWKQIRAPQCSQQHYLWPPRYGSKVSVHQQTNVLRRCDTHTHTHTHTRILCSHKEEWNFAIHNNRDELEWYAKWKKSKTDTVWYYLYVESKKWN